MDAIVQDLSRTPSGERGELVEAAQLQIVCDALWDGAAGDVLDLDAYRSVAGNAGTGNIAHAILHQRIRGELEAIEEERELDLAARLLPLLRTPRHTKWIRAVPDLVALLKADEAPIRTLLGRLAGPRVIEFVVRDRLDAVALTHDYLVDHLDELVEMIRSIWPQRILARALERYAGSGTHATGQELAAIERALAYLDLGREPDEIRRGAVVLFHSALKVGLHGQPLLDYAEGRGVGLDELFGDAVSSASALEASHCAPLLAHVVETRPHWRRASFALLQAMLEDDRKSAYVQHKLGDLSRSAADSIAVTATRMLLDFLSTAGATERVTPEAIATLESIATDESVELLARTLDSPDETLSAAALRALERLASGPDEAVPLHARQVLAEAATARKRARRTPRRPFKPAKAVEPTGKVSLESQRTLRLIAEAVLGRQCILFLGPGVHALPPEGSPFHYPLDASPKTGAALSHRLAAECDFAQRFPNEDPGNLRRVALAYEIDSSRARLVEAVTDAVDTGRAPSPILEMLAQMDFPLVVTTNYDQLFERALRDAGKQPRMSVYQPGHEPTQNLREQSAGHPIIYKLHGDISQRETLVVTDEDHIRFALRMSDKDPYDPIPLALKFHLASSTTLFVGYSMFDYTQRLLFQTLRHKIDVANAPDMYSVDLSPDPLLLDVWQSQRRYVRFIAEELLVVRTAPRWCAARR